MQTMIEAAEIQKVVATLGHRIAAEYQDEPLTVLGVLTGSIVFLADLIRTIVIEEMQHMTIVSNLLIAIGGHPKINEKGFIPEYPGPLPMNIGDLRVGIEAFSIPLVKNVFKAIEEPDQNVPVYPGDEITVPRRFF